MTTAAPPSALGEIPIRIVEISQPPAWLGEPGQPAAQPALRGFRAPSRLTDPPSPVLDPAALPDSAPEKRAAAVIAERLAFDGLLPTAIRALDALRPAAPRGNTAAFKRLLFAVGIPIDLLAHFRPPDADGAQPPPAEDADGSPTPEDAVSFILGRLEAGDPPDDLAAELAAWTFSFRPSRPGFRLADESGRRPPRLIRLQIPSADYDRGPSDGSAIDVAAGLIGAWPDAECVIYTPKTEAAAVATESRNRVTDHPGRITLLSGPWPATQWAQDNGKPGYVTDGHGSTVPATLVPRYANRGEERSLYSPAEHAAMLCLERVGHRLIHSPLIFQGGDLMAVQEPRSNRRTLLIGEAEIARNTALGLTAGQVLDAFRIECGVDRCVVLPAASFHIDFEVSVRTLGDETVAFVNDERTAAAGIVRLSLPVLVREGVIQSDVAGTVQRLLDAGDFAAAIDLLARPVRGRTDGQGRFPPSLARAFAAGPTDDGPANLRRFLVALDLLAARSGPPPDRPPGDMLAAYIRSIHRRAADREAIRRTLAALGWRVVPIPSLAEETLSINYLNAFHEPSRVLMPAYGGFFEALDRAAADAYRAALGQDVKIVAIPSAASQRRLGAIHCAASVYTLP